jgi:hypothetical protein
VKSAHTILMRTSEGKRPFWKSFGMGLWLIRDMPVLASRREAALKGSSFYVLILSRQNLATRPKVTGV